MKEGQGLVTEMDQEATVARAYQAVKEMKVAKTGGKDQMNCVEFQRELPLIIDTGGTPEQEAHLQSCAVCRDLVNDLRYIADQAKLLIPLVEPSPRVWNGIEQRLRSEGLVKPAQVRRS